MALPTTDLLIGKIVAIVENEALSISSVRDEIDEIKQELVSMKSFLQDADGKKENSEGEETWVASVRDLAYDVEDIIDEFMYHIYEKQTGGLFPRWLHKIIHIPRSLWYKRQIANKLQKTTKMIKAIPERNQRYAIGGVEGTTSSIDVDKWVQNQAESSLFIKEDELVGIEGNKQTIMGWLMDEEQHQTIVSVVGMGGSGKTTLVAKTFTNESVKRHFDCYAWITVSRTYAIEDLFRCLIKEFHQSRKEKVPAPAKLKDMSYRELLEKLVNYLESKRYLVVLDDVWDVKLWTEINISLPDRRLGSRILLTTRKEDIAHYSFGVVSHVHLIKPLDNNEAWELFSKKAFSTYHNRFCTPELEPLASKLVEKCKGLPLAIVALGGLMSSKKSTTEWRDVYNSLNWHLTNNPLLDNVKSILLLSYNDLPFRLKQCFLYCSLFPEDYLIRRKRLFRLWISEGLVQHVQGVTPQAATENYLMELIVRSMLQVVRRNETGRPKAFKMHDLMRELALSMSTREKFFVVYDGRESVMEEIGARRLSIQSTEGTEIKSWIGMSKLRTLLVFVTGIIPLSFSNALPSGFKLLRVLDVEDMPLDKLPNDLVYLFNLRYLNLKGTAIRELPKSIGYLHNLHFLDIRKTKIEALPKGFSKLLNLRHLMMYYNNKDYNDFKIVSGTRATSNISKLKKLQVLSRVQSEGNIIRLLGNMTQLTRIGITNLTERDEMDLCDSIQKMKLLTNLSLMVKDEEEFLRADNALFSPPPHLRKLCFIGKLEKVPHWFSSLDSLTSMHLHWPRLEEDLLSHIEGLPFLGSLTLVNAYVGSELRFSRGFVKLSNLQLFKFPSLSKITVEKGVMPNLQFLTLNSCMELKRLPHGLEHLTNLQTLSLEFLSSQLIQSIREGGVDRPKVQHILEINHFFDSSGGRSCESLSPRALYRGE
ncbi:disease resistance protein RPM1 [Rosa chinensis]|uniref:disease resistance protein RPM1 n=1 Tax=Rosa chinensis TaxID=74649 RepID=UPI000D091785|nr:disease resistance protein RPM1 [Rosa chinensis]